jgi:hypothetical protein
MLSSVRGGCQVAKSLSLRQMTWVNTLFLTPGRLTDVAGHCVALSSPRTSWAALRLPEAAASERPGEKTNNGRWIGEVKNAKRDKRAAKLQSEAFSCLGYAARISTSRSSRIAGTSGTRATCPPVLPVSSAPSTHRRRERGRAALSPIRLDQREPPGRRTQVGWCDSQPAP